MSERERREERGLTWRVAVLGAVAALLGTVAGSSATVWIDARDARRADDARVRDLKTAVYKRALSYENRVLDQSTIDAANIAKAITRAPAGTAIKYPPLGHEHLKVWLLQALQDETQRESIAEDLQLYGSKVVTDQWLKFSSLLLDLINTEARAYLKGKDAAPDESTYYVKLKQSNVAFGSLVRAEIVGRFD